MHQSSALRSGASMHPQPRTALRGGWRLPYLLLEALWNYIVHHQHEISLDAEPEGA
jgi:hypothetical protein